MQFNPAPPHIMRCRIKILLCAVLSLGSVISLLLMVYNVTYLSKSHLVRNAAIIMYETPPVDFIQLMNFNDLGSGKEEVSLLVITNSAPHKSDRRMAIRSTWWRHCRESQVNKSYFGVRYHRYLTLLSSPRVRQCK